ncbi:MAG: hydroxymethylpyrimidine/phosphomethylpyrimidine kinase [Bacteroidetes bacterium]|nr:hydroxymethylpyrimidine/phosphomethylpyrimidine kinase [Bacteroidota bacterium]
MKRTSKRYPTALTIAGSDSGGCAGIQADLKTFSAIGVFGASVITAVTAQNTQQVRAVHILPAQIIKEQVEAVLEDILVDVVKIGLLPSPEIIETVAAILGKYPMLSLIVDPLVISSSGDSLVSTPTSKALRQYLFQRISLLTPNIPEAEALSGVKIESVQDLHHAAEKLLSQGCEAVLIKGGHLQSAYANDTLFQAGKKSLCFSSPTIQTRNLHGTGCTLSSAIASYVALGNNLENAVRLAKLYITSAIETGKEIKTGERYGPLCHFFDPKPLKTIDI